MWKSKRPVLSILSALLFCALLIVSFSSGTLMVYAQDDPCEGCSGIYYMSFDDFLGREDELTDEQITAYVLNNLKYKDCLALGCATGVMRLTAYIPSMEAKGTYSPGETVTVEGSVKDAEGNAIPGVSLVIKIEGTDISPLAGTMYDLTNYSGRLDLPKDLSEGTYTVKVTASTTGYPDVSKTTSITVVLPTITLCPSTVPGGDVRKTIEITGTGFGANEQITLYLMKSGTSGTAFADISADADGSFRVKHDIPKNENMGTAGDKHVIEANGTLHIADAEFTVGPSFDDIKNVWFRWGEEKGTWPDGSTDTHRAFHHCFGGGAAANARQWRQLPPDKKQEASHFGCLACQWKTLYFFVQQGKDHNLGGWEFFPIGVIGTRLGEMGGHHAVVLYPAHGNWKTDGYVFDPHQSGIPDSWAVQHISKWDCWDRFSVSFDGYKFNPYWFGGKIVDGSFVRDYDLGCGFKDAYHYDAYEKFPDSYAPEWMTPDDTEKYRVIYETEGRTSPAGNPNPSFYSKCPVNFLVVNSAGERLGHIENGEWVVEFKPEKLDTWPGEDNTPVWYIELPKGDVYTILITGTGSGDLEVFASPEGSDVMFKYPPVDVSIGDKFSMKLDADDPGTPLDTPRGQVSPTEIPIEEYIAIVEPTKDNHPPTASFSIMPQNPTPDDTIVGVSASSDPDGDPLTYSWYFDGEYDSDIGNLPEWTWPNPQAGEYNIELVVEDGEGGSDEYAMTVTVVVGDGLGNRPPTASFALMPENPEVGDYIVVVSTSSDPDGDMLAHSWYLDGVYIWELDDLSSWEWGDAEAGEYIVTLMVEDGEDGIDEYTMAVTVVGDGEDAGTKGKR